MSEKHHHNVSGKNLHDKHGIEHTTFQCEYKRDDNKEIITNG